jgi:hypothetical protein
MNSFVGNTATAPDVDRLPPSSLHVRPRNDSGTRNPGFPPRVPPLAPPGPHRIALDELLRKAATSTAIPDIPSSDTTRMSVDKPLVSDEGFERAQRLASGCVEAADIGWLSKGFSAFLAAGGALPLERCLGLPRNDSALRRMCRDCWLRRAWTTMGDELSPWRRSEKLAVAVRNFRSRQWIRWRTLLEAPKLVSEVDFALFQAFRSSERVPETAMQLHNIAHHRRHS